MTLYNGYSQIRQVGAFGSDDAALKALAPKPEPKKIEQPKAVPTVPVPPDPATTEPLTAFDTVTGKEAEWPEDKQPTAEEQITAQAQRGTEPEPLKAQDIKKAKVDSTPAKQMNHHLLETMRRNISFQQRGQWVRVPWSRYDLMITSS